MCGIAGVVRVDPGTSAPPLDVAEWMAARLRHRGPDGVGAWRSPDGRCVLGHSRLRVIDLETGGQPMANEDGRIQVVFNGEIYNFRGLRAELERAGHRFRSRSDTEVIVHGYEEWGDAVVERLDGMFAFGLWDDRSGRLLLARDRAGKKPLFLARRGGWLLFASELGALLVPGREPELDPVSFRRYLTFGYVPAPHTFYRDVEKLPPAHAMSVEQDGGERRRRYWRLPTEEVRRSPAEAARGVRERLEAAVEKRLVADVPLGAFLSGGLDSTAVVALMTRVVDEPVRTFAIGFRDQPLYDETAFARLAAERLGTRHEEFLVDPPGVEMVGRLVRAYGEPFGDSSALPTFIVSELTRRHVTVALTGDGGDELFAGYARFLGMRLAGAVPSWAVAAGRALGRVIPHHPDFRSVPRRFQRFVAAASLDPGARMQRWIGFVPLDRVDDFLRSDRVPPVPEDELLRSFREPWDEAGGTDLARTLALNYRTYLPEDLLVKADRCSMANSLELRSPFLDTDLVEYVFRLGDRHKATFLGGTKRVLRAAVEDVVPREVLERGKMGFGIPLPEWLRGEWRPLLEERLLAPDARVWEWLRREPVETMVREHLARSADWGHPIWALLTLEEWLRSLPARMAEPAGRAA